MNSLINKAALGGILLGLTPLVHAAPSVALGDDASLFFKGAVSLEHQSNILRASSDEQSDTIFIVTPGLELQIGGSGAFYANFDLGYQIRRHFDSSNLDGEYARLNFGSLYDSGMVVVKSYAGYNEFGTSTTVLEADGADAAGVVEQKNLAAGVSGKYRLTEQMALSAGVDFFQRDWSDYSQSVSTSLTGSESLAFPVKLFFAIAPELDAFVGYRYRTVEAYDVPVGETATDYSDNYYFVGVEGELFNPLWTVNLDVGFQEREYDIAGSVLDGTSTDGLTFSGRVNYAADANQNYYVILARDYGESSARAISYERTRLTLGGDYRISEMWSTYFGVTLSESLYEEDPADIFLAKREEHLLIGKIGVNYIPNEYLTIGASYQYIDVNLDNAYTTVWDEDTRSSVTVANPGYDNNVFQVTASVRY